MENRAMQSSAGRRWTRLSSGFSIIEAILAVGVFVIIAAGLLTMVVGPLQSGGATTTISVGAARYQQYRITLAKTDVTQTPSVGEAIVTYRK